MLRAKAAPVSFRSSVQWQRNLIIGVSPYVMTLEPQRQDDCVIVKIELVLTGGWVEVTK